MARTLSDDDVEAIALRILQMVVSRLSRAETPSVPEIPKQTAQESAKARRELPPKLAYTLKELSVELGVSKTSIYRLTYRGLLKPLPYFRTKIFAKEEVERFLAAAVNWNLSTPRNLHK